MLAQVLLQTHQPERAIEAVTADPKLVQRPALAVLLARAYWEAQKLPEAAKAFEAVYYTFPTSPESAVAGAALKQLRPQLGASFPPVTEQLEQRAASPPLCR